MEDPQSLVLATDGLRFILRTAKECVGCHVMHYFFITTIKGNRCIGCAKGDPLCDFFDLSSFHKGGSKQTKP